MSGAKIFIGEFESGQSIDGQIYCLKQKDLRTTTSGALYIHAVFVDRTGQIPGRMWQASEDIYKSLPQEGFVQVRGRVENYKGSLQFIIEGIQAVDSSKIDIADFLPSTDKDVDEMFNRTLEILRTVKDKNLLYLIKQFVEDKELMEQFKRAPAATNNHHAYLGGLLEHTLNIMELAVLLSPRYSEVNSDILLIGAFLHDIGKTRELKYDEVFKYTDVGQFIGHLSIGAMLAEKKASLVSQETGEPFPAELLQMIQHMILSHHGQYDFGSPVLPKTAEAIMLHYLDNLDAKLEQVKNEVAKSEKTDPDSRWTGYVRPLERPLFKGLKHDEI